MAESLKIKGIRVLTCLLLLGVGLLLSTTVVLAETRRPISSSLSVQNPVPAPDRVGVTIPARVPPLADLSLQFIKVKSPLYEGDRVENNLSFVIVNQGGVSSTACMGQITCSALPLDVRKNAIMGIVSRGGLLSIPSIPAGSTVRIEWPRYTTETWLAGEYRILVDLDVNHRVKESNENNNRGEIRFHVAAREKVIPGTTVTETLKPLPAVEVKRNATSGGGAGERRVTGVDFKTAANTGAGKREIKGVDFVAVPNVGTGKREITAVDFTAVSNLGTGKREITGVDFAAMPNIGSGKREISGVDFTAAPNTGAGERTISGVDFTAVSNTGAARREITGVDFMVLPPAGR